MTAYIVSLIAFGLSIMAWSIYPCNSTVFCVVLFGICYMAFSTRAIYNIVHDAYAVVAPIETGLTLSGLVRTYEDEASKIGVDISNVMQSSTMYCCDNGNSYELTIKRINSDEGIKELISETKS